MWLLWCTEVSGNAKLGTQIQVDLEYALDIKMRNVHFYDTMFYPKVAVYKDTAIAHSSEFSLLQYIIIKIIIHFICIAFFTLLKDVLHNRNSKQQENIIKHKPVMWWREEVCIRGAEASGGSVTVEQVSEVRRGLVMEGFECEEKDFKLDTLGNRELVEVVKDRGDCRVLDVLKFVQDFGRLTI